MENEMIFTIMIKSKKGGGSYFILMSRDSYGLPRIWGRFKKMSKARDKKDLLEKKYSRVAVI